MDLLYDEDYYQKSKKKSKLPIIIGIIIIILVALSIAIIYLIIYLNSTVMRIKIDGNSMNEIEEILYITEDENKLYIPIRKIAKYFGYEDYNGDYKNKSEDTSKCHVKNEYETAMFTLDSDILIKTTGDSDYEYITIDEKVFEKDGELYTTIEGIKQAFNAEFEYDAENKKINIYTMPFLIEYYATKLKLEDYEESFTNQKTIFENMLIIEQDNQYGVIDATTGESILETKYQSISYLPNTKDFLVESNNKYGIVTKDKSIKVKIAYEDIKIMDNQNGLYLIKENNRYGVVDTEGKVILSPEYEQIGIDASKFSQNGVENPYIILDKLIPIKNNKLWGFFNLEGEQVTDFKYTEIGCTSSKVANSYPLAVIPSYDIVIVGINKKYTLMKTTGQEIISGYPLDDVYMKTNTATGENTFYMAYGEKTEDIRQRLDSLGIE